MAVLKELMKLDPSIQFGTKKTSVPSVTKPVPVPTSPAPEAGTAASIGLLGVVTAFLSDPQNIPMILGGAVLAAVIGWAVVRWYRERQAIEEMKKQVLTKQLRKGKK
jgi:hypothetical protein